MVFSTASREVRVATIAGESGGLSPGAGQPQQEVRSMHTKRGKEDRSWEGEEVRSLLSPPAALVLPYLSFYSPSLPSLVGDAALLLPGSFVRGLP